MKHFFAFLIAMSIATSGLFASGCNDATPGWGDNLGVISTATDNVWRIIGTEGRVTQIWSDAVTATACNKTFFFGGPLTPGEFNADCRSNPGFPGDLFSWCAIYRFGHLLCPYPWRVPTAEDFANLDRNMGGTGESRPTLDRRFVTGQLFRTWGGALGGRTSVEGRLTDQAQGAHYWAITEVGDAAANAMHFNIVGQIYPRRTFNKNEGFSLRCVR